MGYNDHIEDENPELPPEAGEVTQVGFELDNDWIRSTTPELRHGAMRVWFLSRFCDPANETPYDGREGGYLYVHGGPYSAEEELYRRFGELFQDEVVRAVIEDVEADGILDWAPIHTEPDYDVDFELALEAEFSACRLFSKRLAEADALASTELDSEDRILLRQLLYSHLIGALEAYLADTMAHWLKANREVFKRFVANCEEFKKEKFSLSCIFERLEDLEGQVDRYVQKTVWHRLDKVMPLMASSFDFNMPDISQLMAHIVTRHDIVHRGGKSREGHHVEITSGKLAELRECVTTFVDKLESEISESIYGEDF